MPSVRINEVVVALMIEKQSAVEQLEQILSVPGVDMVQWGPADYCMSIGRPEARRSPEVKEVERRVIETCLRKGIPPRAEIQTPAEAEWYQRLGVRHFCLGTDLLILHDWWRDNGQQLRNRLGAARAAAEGAERK